MNNRISNLHNLIRIYCMNKIDGRKNEWLLAQRRAFGILEETENMDQEQVHQVICDKLMGMSREMAEL